MDKSITFRHSRQNRTRKGRTEVTLVGKILIVLPEGETELDEEILMEAFRAVYGFKQGYISRAFQDIAREWLSLTVEERNKIKEKYDHLYSGKKRYRRRKIVQEETTDAAQTN